MEYVCEDFVIAYKEHGIPTVPLKNQKSENTLLYRVAYDFPDVLLVHGKNEWEGGALHRLDTDTAGLVVFARTQQFFDYLSNIQRNGGFSKLYDVQTSTSVLEDCTISSYFRAYGVGRKLVKAESSKLKSDNGILYSTFVKKISENHYQCTIFNGFRHQIRVHLASNGCPIVGDKLYNPQKTEDFMHLECIAVMWDNFAYQLG